MTQWFPRARSIFIKQLASYLLMILLISSMISFMFFSTARRHFEEEIGAKLQNIVQIVARNTPFERLNLIRVGDDNARMVLRLKQKLAEISEATGVKKIYIFNMQMGALLDLSPDTPIGFVYDLPQLHPSFLEPLKSGRAVHTAGYIKGQDSFFISAYAPILDPSGDLFAVVGVDAGTEQLKIIEHMRTRLYWITLAIIGLAFMLALYFTRSITFPIQHIARVAEQFGNGDYEARVSVNSPDELGQLSTSINRMAEQVRRRDVALKEMSATVAHEIRNPLNSMKLLLSLLEEQMKPANPTQTATIETLHYEIGKLNRFISEFLTYSRPITLARDQIAPDHLISAALEMAAAHAQEHDVKIVHQTNDTLPDVAADRLRMEQVLLNLVINAIQACPPGGQVTVQTRKSRDGIDFIVDDTGSGIDPQVFPHLFAPFFTTKEDGTGLGLANSAKIVAEHQGTIKPENMPSGGARFTLHLPETRLISAEVKDDPHSCRGR
ncbi:MAG: ATP-binding protein [bacterium]|nr:ATP-binding protein [bacterium]